MSAGRKTRDADLQGKSPDLRIQGEAYGESKGRPARAGRHIAGGVYTIGLARPPNGGLW